MRNDPLYKLYYEPFSFMNETFVGFSAFHAGFSTLSYFSQGVGVNLPRAIGAALRGTQAHELPPGQLAKTTNLPGEPHRGRQIYRTMEEPQAQTPS